MRSQKIDKEAINLVFRLLTPENRVIMRVAIATGLRIDDVLGIKTEQLMQKSFTVREKKTGKKRKIELSERLKIEMMRFAGTVFVFQHRDDAKKHKTRQAVWKDMKRAAWALRISENVTPHSARKIFADLAMQRYGSLEKVQKLLNHSSPEVTYFYYLVELQKKPPKSHENDMVAW